MSAIDLEAIEARADAATAGPWRIDTFDIGPLASICSTTRDYPGGWVETAKSFGADAVFIAASREDVPGLVARVKELEAALGRVQTALADIRYAEHLGFDLGPKETVTHVRAAIEGGTK